MVETGVVRVGISAPTYLLALDLNIAQEFCARYITQLGLQTVSKYISVTQNVRTRVPMYGRYLVRLVGWRYVM